MGKYSILIVFCFFVLKAQSQNFDQPAGVLSENLANPYNANSVSTSYRGFGSFEGAPVWLSISGNVLLTDNFVSGIGYKIYSVGYYKDKEISLASNYSILLNKNWTLSLGAGLDWLQAKMDFVSMYQKYSVVGLSQQNEDYSGVQLQAAFMLANKSWFFGFDGKYLLTELGENEKNIVSVDNKQNIGFQLIAGKKFILIPTVLDMQLHISTEFSDVNLFKDPKTMPLQGGLFLDIYQRINVGLYGRYPEGLGMKIYVKNDVIGLSYSYFADMRVGFSQPGHQIGLIFMLDRGKNKPLLRTDYSTRR